MRSSHTPDFGAALLSGAMFEEWIARGLQKPGKTQDGLASVLHVDRTAISKIISRRRQLKADEIVKAAEYLDEPPPDRLMPIRYVIGAGQECVAVDDTEAFDYESVSGMWGVEAELALVRGDSMRPVFGPGSKIFFGLSRPPEIRDHYQMRVVRLADDRVMVKIMKRTADPAVWDLESFNAPPIEGVVVSKVAEIIRVDPAR